ncbi:hypothetical protein OB236_11365 [Paenibacillus sp. WQ 127069]|uniref:AraC family transcriptional regulator n=1 Tax=Paenibacillus baimaensis TaxID=2982185 RepID=A0ABT2UDJ1_9BACL|nr:hypothetical protein [Paenibacillus sp. WQ 127069]
MYEWRDSANSNKTIFQRAQHFIQEHYSQNCSIVQVAEHVHLNPSYINKLKLERAQVLLRNTDMKNDRDRPSRRLRGFNLFCQHLQKIFSGIP